MLFKWIKFIGTFPERIGAYDKQLWETSAEEKVLKGIQNAPKKSAKVKPELIDVDLVRGSTFTKAKPQHSWMAVARKGIVRVLLLPFFYRWWQRQTSCRFWAFLLVLYLLQVTAVAVYFNDSGDTLNVESVSMAHLVSPIILMFIMGMIHAQIVATHLTHKQRRPRQKDKRKLSKTRKKSRNKQHQSDRDKATSGEESRCRKSKATSRSDKNTSSGLTDLNCNSEGSDSQQGSKVVTSNTSGQSADTEGQQDINARSENMQQLNLKTSSGFIPQCSNSCHSGLAEAECRDFEDEKSNGEKKEVNGSETEGLIRCSVQSLVGEKNHRKVDSEVVDVNGAKVESVILHADISKTVDQNGACQVANNGEDKCHVTCQTGSNGVNKNHVICHNGEYKNHVTAGHSEIESHVTYQAATQGEDEHPMTCQVSSHGADKNHMTYKGSEIEDGVFVNSCSSENWDLLNEPLPEPSGENLVPDTDQVQLTKSLFIPVDKLHVTNQNGALESVWSDFGQNTSRKNGKSAEHENDDESFGLDTSGSSFLVEKLRERSLSGRQGDSSPSTEMEQHTESENTDYHLEMHNGGSRTANGRNFSDSESQKMCDKLCHMRSNSTGSNLRRRRKPSRSDLSSPEIQKAVRIRGRRPESLPVGSMLDNKESTGVSSGETDGETTPTTPTFGRGSGRMLRSALTRDWLHAHSDQGQTSEMEWEDTMNTDDVTTSDSNGCSTDSDLMDKEEQDEDPFAWGQPPCQHQSSKANVTSVMNNLASGSDRVSCMIWEGEEVKKVDLTVLDISYSIIQKVDKIPETCDYLVLGVAFSTLMCCLPVLFRAYHSKDRVDYLTLTGWYQAIFLIIGADWRVWLLVLNGVVQRLCLGLVFFFLLSVGERTFKQRLLYAKHFCYLTSSRRAKKYELPHFRLNKVRNIKTWLSLRSYMKKRGPQRSVDTIVSSAFLLAVTLVSFMCIELLKDSGTFLDHLGNWELLAWCMALGIYLLRFMTLGTKINKKYRNFSVLITEQINLYLHMEQKPHKKEELMLANSVLKLAEDLLKELESPFKISGLSANPFLYNITKVIILSAFSAVLTELLGFKLKLYKIKIRP